VKHDAAACKKSLQESMGLMTNWFDDKSFYQFEVYSVVPVGLNRVQFGVQHAKSNVLVAQLACIG
jgi:hypothetical protein